VDSDELWKREECERSLFGFENEEGRSVVTIFVILKKGFLFCFSVRVLAFFNLD